MSIYFSFISLRESVIPNNACTKASGKTSFVNVLGSGQVSPFTIIFYIREVTQAMR